jgi:uncharacterized protein YndB with AHSA1/START domain
MGFPDRIERTVHVDRPQQQVWAAITTAEGLGAWFGDSAEIDLRVGGSAKLTWSSGDSAQLRIERLEPQSVFGYTWGISGLPDHDLRRTYVEFTLAPSDGGTDITVIESGFAQLEPDAYAKAFEDNTGGWAHELGELVTYLGG